LAVEWPNLPNSQQNQTGNQQMTLTNTDSVNEKMYRKMFLQDYDPLPWQLTWQLKYQVSVQVSVQVSGHVKFKVSDQVNDQVYKQVLQINPIRNKIKQEINK
jgi:hypothetical protein